MINSLVFSHFFEEAAFGKLNILCLATITSLIPLLCRGIGDVKEGHRWCKGGDWELDDILRDTEIALFYHRVTEASEGGTEEALGA
jgi:hypothetical protein